MMCLPWIPRSLSNAVSKVNNGGGYYQTPLSHFIERVQPEHDTTAARAAAREQLLAQPPPHSHLLSDPGPVRITKPPTSVNLFLSNCVWRRAVCWHVGNTALRTVAYKAVYGAAIFFMKLALASPL